MVHILGVQLTITEFLYQEQIRLAAQQHGFVTLSTNRELCATPSKRF